MNILSVLLHLLSAHALQDCQDLTLKVIWLQDSTLWNHELVAMLHNSSERLIPNIMQQLKEFNGEWVDMYIKDVQFAFAQYADKPGPITGQQRSLWNGQWDGLLTTKFPTYFVSTDRYDDAIQDKVPSSAPGPFYHLKDLQHDSHYPYRIPYKTLVDDHDYLLIQEFTNDPDIADVFNRQIRTPSGHYKAFDFESVTTIEGKFFIPQHGADFKNNQWDATLKALNDPTAGWDHDDDNTIKVVINVTQSFAHKDVEPCDFKDSMTLDERKQCQPPNYNAEYHPLFGFGPHSFGDPWCRELESAKPLSKDNQELEISEISRMGFGCTNPWQQPSGYEPPVKQAEYPWGAATPSTGSFDSLKSLRRYMQFYLLNDAYPNYLYHTMDYDLRKQLMEFITCCQGFESWYRGTNHFLMQCKPEDDRNKTYISWSPKPNKWDAVFFDDYSTFFPRWSSTDTENNEKYQEQCYLCQLFGGHGLSAYAGFTHAWDVRQEQCCWHGPETYPWYGRWDIKDGPYSEGGCPKRDDIDFKEYFSVDVAGSKIELGYDVHQWGLPEIKLLMQFLLHPINENQNLNINEILPYNYDTFDYDMGSFQVPSDFLGNDARRGAASNWESWMILMQDFLPSLFPGGGNDGLLNKAIFPMPVPYASNNNAAQIYDTSRQEYPNPFSTEYSQRLSDLDASLIFITIPPVVTWDEWIYSDLLSTRIPDHDPWDIEMRLSPHDPSILHTKGVIEEYFTDTPFLLEQRDYSFGPEDAHWMESPMLLAAAHACPNLKNDPFTVYSCTRRIKAEHCVKELTEGNYVDKQDIDKIKECQTLVGKNIGGCRKDPYSILYPLKHSNWRYNNVFENSMLWKQHEAYEENISTTSQKYPSEHEMRGAQYCTSIEWVHEGGNPCPIELCSCSEEIAGFDIAYDDFFADPTTEHPYVNLDIQRQWWSDCFEFEYGRIIEKINENNDKRASGKPTIARMGHVENLGDGEAIIKRIEEEIMTQLRGVLEEVDTCSLTTENPEGLTTDGWTQTTENPEVVVTPITAAISTFGVIFALFASCYGNSSIELIGERVGKNQAKTMQNDK